MIEIFYYIGCALLLRAIYLFVSPTKETKQLGEQMSEMPNPISTPYDSLRLVLKYPINLFMGVITISWEIGGIFVSTELRYLFISLLVLLIVFPILLFSIREDKRQKFGKFDDLITILIVCVILFNHFYYGKN